MADRMVDRMSVEQVDDLLALLQSNASVDAKVQQVATVKSNIKQQNVPEQCIAALFEALRVASSNAHSSLANAGFTTLNHLITRLSLQEPRYLAKEARHTLPLVIDKLGDQKEKLRALATHALTTLHAAAPLEVERFVKNTAMAGKSNRAKEASMHWVHQMHDEHAMGFKPYVPSLMELLEDADPNVRDVAKTTVIELFRNAPGAAKADLKKQLTNFKVRPAIAGAITKEIGPGTASAAAGPRSVTPVEFAPPPSRSAINLSASVSSLASERPITPGPDGRAEPVEPAYLNTSRELDDIFRPMETYFDGRETEQNWLKREESITKLRCLIAGNAVTDFHDQFVLGLRALLDGIIKAISSLRTSLSKEGCALVQDMAVSLGPAMDPMVELLMQTFTKLAASTKKISAGMANTTLDIIISNVTYTNRLMVHIVGAVNDKNVQPRVFATGWLATLLKKEANHKGHLEHTGGLDHVEKSIKKGLIDSNPGVRERMRGTYWLYAGIWPARADVLMESLDPQAQKLLRNDPRNPDGGKPEASRPGLGLSKSTMGTSSSKPSLRDTMMAQKKAALAARNNLPSRPGSAMAHFSPATTTVSGGPSACSAATTSGATVRAKPETSTSGMSGAPMRPARRRPELAARPATAGPYSVRGHDKEEPVEPDSPPEVRHARNLVTPKPAESSPRRAAQRPYHGHSSALSEGSVSGSPARSKIPKQISSPRQSPSTSPTTPRLGHVHAAFRVSSPSRAEEFTLVVPPVPSVPEQLSHPAPPTEPEQQEQAPSPEPRAVQEAPVATEEAPAGHTAATEVPEPEQKRPATPPPPPQFVPSDTPVGTPTIQIYEDPLPRQPEPAQPTVIGPVLEDKSINDAVMRVGVGVVGATENGINGNVPSPDKQKQNSRLLDSGIAKIKAKSLDVHGFRKLQSLIRENKAPLTDDKFGMCVAGLFAYLEDPLGNVTPEKGQDVKAQILATIRVLLKKERNSFRPHVATGLNSILSTRSAYDARAHIVSGLEVLADDLVSLGDGSDMIMAITQRLDACSDMTTEGCRCLGTGMFVLRSILEKLGASYEPSTREIERLGELAARGIESVDSGVRMESVQLCVALHARIGETRFWSVLRSAREDPKNLITYYIVRKQQERPVAV